jgi:hypothetical protein
MDYSELFEEEQEVDYHGRNGIINVLDLIDECAIVYFADIDAEEVIDLIELHEQNF